ncbi:MAG: ComEC/Rec2 family competence protein [Endomicrobia bacterium]|nr:ComEC/Rec2 family competence protein [Endomicrobiia bacterium]MDW8055816.1 ComEC/Rec2 family competence protein [Elusimicrobiota bacterium]
MDLRNKIANILENSVIVLWFFVAGVGIGIIGYTSNISILLSPPHYIFLIVCFIFIIISIIIPEKEVLPKLTFKRLFLVFASFSFGVFWYLKDMKVYPSTHLLTKENGKYKFIDTDFSQTSVIYGTIVTDPDIREDATNIVIKPDRIIPSPKKGYTIEIDTSTARVIVENEFVVKVTDGDTFVTKSGNKVRLMAVNAPEIGQEKADEATEFLRSKILNKHVTLIIQEDYMFDIYDRVLAVVFVNNENVNKLLLESGLGQYYDDPNIKIIKKLRCYQGEEVKIENGSGLIRAKVLPTIGEYYLQMSYGDYVKIVSPLLLPKKATNPAGFDYRKYLNARGIYAVTKTIRDSSEIQYIGMGKVNFIVKLAFILRKKILTTIRKTVPYPQSAFLGGVTLGYRGGVPQKIREQFQATGVAHVLALSGLHTGFIAALLLMICRIFKIKSFLRFILVSIALTIFVIMTGASPATTRSALMFCTGLFMYDVLKLSLVKSSRMTIIIAACVILLLNPSLLPDASFVLSFMAVWSLIYVSPVVEKILIYTNSKLIHQFITFPLFSVVTGMTLLSLFGGILQEVSLVRKLFPFLVWFPSLDVLFPKWFNIPTSRWLYKGEFFLLSLVFYFCGVIAHYLYSLSGKLLVKDMRSNPTLRTLIQFVCAQVAIQLGMMWPLSSVYFYRFPISGFYANFLAIPLIGWIVQLGWIAGIIDLVFTLFSSLFGFKIINDIGVNIALIINAFNNQLCQMFLGMAKTWGNFVPYPYVEMFSSKSLLIWYLILGIIIWFDKIKEMFIKYRLKVVVTSVIIFFSLIYYFLLPEIKKTYSVRLIFFDVGFGNAVLITTPTKNVLIDTGPPGPPGWSPAESAISPTLTYYKIKKFDSVVITSLKPQCIGGLPYLLSHFRTEKLYLPHTYKDCTSFTYYDFLEKFNLWYYMSNPYLYEVTGLYNENYKLSRFLKNYRGDVKIVSSNEELILEEIVSGKPLRVTIINPGGVNNTMDEPGNNSFAVRITFGQITILIPSQVGFELQEKFVMDMSDKLTADILLVPQNGFSKSVNKNFLYKVSPKIAICQYGWTNQRIGYFFSSYVTETANIYEELGIKFLRTDYVGAVVVELNGEEFKYTTGISKEEYETRLATEQENVAM